VAGALMATRRTLRAQLAALSSLPGVWTVPPGSPLDLLRRGRPVVLSSEMLASHVAPCDRPVDLSLAAEWVLTGDDTLTPVEG
jgi:hypothetical protein